MVSRLTGHHSSIHAYFIMVLLSSDMCRDETPSLFRGRRGMDKNWIWLQVKHFCWSTQLCVITACTPFFHSYQKLLQPYGPWLKLDIDYYCLSWKMVCVCQANYNPLPFWRLSQVNIITVLTLYFPAGISSCQGHLLLLPLLSLPLHTAAPTAPICQCWHEKE